MATAATSFDKIIQKISTNKNFKTLLGNLNKLASDLKDKESEIKVKIDKEKDAALQKAWNKYQDVVKTISKSETALEKELSTALTKLKKSADEIEKNLTSYKKKALAQKALLEKTILKKTSIKAKGTKKAAKTTKKATTKKAASRTTKKATTKKSV